jgi:hypothetical protein
MFMTPAEKGSRYARMFRKAGLLLGRGRVSHAVLVLEEGRMFAERMGDHGMARRFALEVERANANSYSPFSSDN